MATSLARDSGATLLIVHVEEIPISTGGGEFVYAIPTVPTDTLRQSLNEVMDGVYPHPLYKRKIELSSLRVYSCVT